MSSFYLYLLLKADAVHALFMAAAIFLGMASAVVGIGLFIGELKHSIKSTALFLAFALSTVLCVITPNTKELAALLVLPKVINYATESNEMRALPANMVALANKWLLELQPDSVLSKSARKLP